MNIIKSIKAVLAGFIFIALTHTSTDIILESIGVLPKGNLFVGTGIILFVIFYRTVFSLIGCYITASLSPQNPITYSVVLGVLGAVLSTIGAIVNMNMNLGPNWYAWTLVATSIPIAWVAGKLYVHAQKNILVNAYTVTTTEITKEQIWKLFTDVDNWHVWNTEIEYAILKGKFEAGNSYRIKPKNGGAVTVHLLEVKENAHCLESGNFPLAKMYYDHTIEETPQGLRITNSITMKGLLSSLWIRLVVNKIANEMPAHVEQQIKVASKIVV